VGGTTEKDCGRSGLCREDNQDVSGKGDLIIRMHRPLAGCGELGQLKLFVLHVERSAPGDDPASLSDEFHRYQRDLSVESILARATRR
jgi:hypothetical protein